LDKRERHTPLSDYLFDGLRNPLREYLPGDREYDEAFTWFEYFLCVASLDARLEPAHAEDLASSIQPEFRQFWIPMGRFTWNTPDPDALWTPDRIEDAMRSKFFEGKGQKKNRIASLRVLAQRFTFRVRETNSVFF
jgi:hypothetical protein